MCALMMLSCLGVLGLASGPLAECPCCAGDGMLPGISVDFCFALPHLARCGSSSVQLRPPNSKLFLDDAAMSQQLASASSTMGEPAADADRACSDFNAARVLARTSEKVGAHLPAMPACPLFVACLVASSSPSPPTTCQPSGRPASRPPHVFSVGAFCHVPPCAS